MRIIKFRAKDKDNIWRYGIQICINGSFVCKTTKTHYKALYDIGLFDLKAVWNELSHCDDEEKGPYYDYIGNRADENIIGLEVINNCN